MRKSALLTVFGMVCLLASFASAQQGDVMIGGGTLLSSTSNNTSVTTLPAEKGGFYPSIGVDVVFHRRIGFNFETSWRGSQGLYVSDGFASPYRPILYDFNALYQPRLGRKLGADLMAGVGGEDLRFYTPYYSCSFTCTNYTSSNHFMEHIGGGLRYYVWHHVFVRPEVHYYHVENNLEFNSGNIFRVGASIGYTIGPD